MQNMTEGNVPRRMVSFAIPLLFGNVGGAAYATVVSQAISAVLCIGYIKSWLFFISFPRFAIRFRAFFEGLAGWTLRYMQLLFRFL